ncbi:uncharacterized protein PODANS_1_12890 [Podospora anserina S mat+]|uniref:Podospora anserina S mat+ genomic DNA chromosome 1, supercontig 3 n=1 Tax=Podospora anserina (strain S / ATCC MYA-4624 / DSM 980 / FGSC 10383) TaxID=515849 RepID=B2ALV0_PODAN|nr:uncharacterized protein PODANS_1_12890 [Podospora anserina S mat+]CAP64898.1 unnamed protein product [Podospora anserina S mat+]CDP23790.1 Putative protein of unknown function [Podospora anserina S mat+]
MSQSNESTIATSYSVSPVGPYPYSGLQTLGLFLLGFFPLLSITACVLRVWSRRLCQGLGLDDYLIFVATGVFAALYMRAGYWGIHDIDIPPHPANQGLFFAYLNRVFYSPLLALVKISALLFLLRLGGTKHFVHISCRALILFNILQVCAFLPATIFNCTPVEYVWTKPTGSGKCFNSGLFAVALASTNIVTDILTLLVPFVAFKDLRLGWRIRAALLTVFALGAAVTCISIVRLYSVIRVWYLRPADGHYTIGYTTNTIEVNLAIVTATIPALWPLARVWFPDVFESMGINRPYLYPDIEVQVRASVGQQITSPALRAKTLWLPRRPHTPSYIRGSASPPTVPGDREGNTRHRGLADWQRQNAAVVERDEEDDYHGIIRWTNTSAEPLAEQDDEDFLIIQKTEPSR